jgi:ABC-type multidrug transport system fused ATPase/permease subunit
MERDLNDANNQQINESKANRNVELAISYDNPHTIDEIDKKHELDLKKEAENKEENKKKIVSFWKLQCHFSDKVDITFLVIAFIGSIGAGVSMPIFALIFGATINSFNDNNINDPKQLSSIVGNMAINYIIAGSGILFFSAIMVTFWTINGKRLIKKIKEEYFKVILKQEQGWFDNFNPFEYATRVSSQTKTIENGVRV